MDYKFWLCVLISFLLGRLSKIKIYIGSDNNKYENSDFGILLNKEQK